MTAMKGDKEWWGRCHCKKGFREGLKVIHKERPNDGEKINHWLLEEGTSRQREQQTLKPGDKSMPPMFKDIEEAIWWEESK